GNPAFRADVIQSGLVPGSPVPRNASMGPKTASLAASSLAPGSPVPQNAATPEKMASRAVPGPARLHRSSAPTHGYEKGSGRTSYNSQPGTGNHSSPSAG